MLFVFRQVFEVNGDVDKNKNHIYHVKNDYPIKGIKYLMNHSTQVPETDNTHK
jgi:hypothetical protein